MTDILDSQGDINRSYIDFKKSWDEIKDSLDAAEKDSLCNLTPTNRGNRTKPDWDDSNIAFLFPENDDTEYVDTSNQINHEVIPGSPIQPHCHIIQTHAGTPVFEYTYRLLNTGEAPTDWVTVELDTAVSVYDGSKPTMANIIKVADKLDGTLVRESTIIQGKLRRKSGDGYAGDVIVTDVDIHYLAGKVGKTF